MIIPRQLPQFKDRKSLILATSSKKGILYLAENGELKKQTEFELPTKKLEKEKRGFFMTRSGGSVQRAGSLVGGSIDSRKSFIKETEKVVKSFLKKEKVDEIYIFSSIYVYKEVVGVFSQRYRSKIKLAVRGNYLKKHPLDLLKKIPQS